MSLKLSLKFKQHNSIQLSKTHEKNDKKTLLPFINNENYYLSDQFQHRYCSKSTRLSQPKGTILPLTSRNNVNNQNQVSTIQDKKDKNNKKSNRPQAAKPKSINTKNLYEKKMILESKQTSNNQKKQIKLAKIKPKESDTFVQNEEIKPMEVAINTLCLEKTNSSNNRSQNKIAHRDRTYSCKVAFKKVFPQPEKMETNNLDIYFQRNQQKLSTIPGGSQNGSQKFISMESYSELIF